jgi:hypothetical protein
MHRTLAAIGCCLVVVSSGRGDPPVYSGIPGSIPPQLRRAHNVKEWTPMDYDDTPGTQPGGLVFIRQGNQRIWRVGGGLLPMRVKVTETGPDGPVTTRMVFPSAAQSSAVPLALQGHATAVPLAVQGQAAPAAPTPGRACAQVQMPDPSGLLYMDERLTDTDGASRQVQSPPLADGQVHVFRLRAAFRVGDNLLIEDKQVAVRSGQLADVRFDGAKAISVPLPKTGPEQRASRER